MRLIYFTYGIILTGGSFAIACTARSNELAAVSGVIGLGSYVALFFLWVPRDERPKTPPEGFATKPALRNRMRDTRRGFVTSDESATTLRWQE